MKNIMLLFVSDFKLKKDAQTNFDLIPESTYKYIDSGKKCHEFTTQHTNESAVRALYCEVGPIDKIFAFTTDLVREKSISLQQEIKQYAYFKEIVKKFVN